MSSSRRRWRRTDRPVLPARRGAVRKKSAVCRSSSVRPAAGSHSAGQRRRRSPMSVMNARRVGVLLAAALLAGCTSAPAASTTTRPAGSASSSSARPADLPAAIGDVMDKTLYAQATWSLLVTDVDTGESLYALNPDVMSFTGSTRKLFSVGAALDQLGADARQPTPVYRQGTVDDNGVLTGNLVLVGGGDLAFGGRRIDANTVQYTDFDHNDANGLGT